MEVKAALLALLLLLSGQLSSRTGQFDLTYPREPDAELRL